jgi:4,5-DOPA dioxygenase extradiol
MNWRTVNEGFDWAQRFDEAAKERMLTNPIDFAALDAHTDYGLAVPTPDDFIPALYLAGLAGIDGPDRSDTRVLIDGYAYGSLSMTAYTLGMECPSTNGEGGSPQVAADLPPDASNI